MRHAVWVVSCAALLLAPFACELEMAQFRANKVMVGTLLSSPEISVEMAKLLPADAGWPDGGADWDGGIPDGGFDLDGGDADGGMPIDGDAGLNLDGGGVFVDGGYITLPGQTTAYIFFGSRSSTSFNSAPVGVTGAQVSLGPAGQAAIALREQEKGAYSLTSVEEPTLTYEEGKTYEFKAQYEEASFVGEVSQVPALERIEALHPEETVISHEANMPMTLTRAAPNDANRPMGFVTVVPFNLNGERGNPTYTNMPNTAMDFLNLTANPKRWKEDTIEIPATAFPEADKTYLVIFQSAKMGGPKSDNLFTGSALLAGTADVGVVKTNPE